MGGTLTYRSRACSLSLSLGLLDGLVRKLSWACSPARCARRFGLCMSENRVGRNQWGSREYRRTSWLVHRGTRAPPLEPLAELACTRLLESVRATLRHETVVRRLSVCVRLAPRRHEPVPPALPLYLASRYVRVWVGGGQAALSL